MQSKSGDIERQKRVPLSYRIQSNEHTEGMNFFQISVSILEARKLTWLNPHAANSYVIIVCGKKKFRTTLRRNMLEPYYNETFTFDMQSSLHLVQRTNLWLAIMEPRCYATPRILGETTLDLNAIWSQPNHQIINKWTQLQLPRNSSFGPVGFLKVNVSISFIGDTLDTLSIRSDRFEGNLLSGLEQQSANYQITVYEAINLSFGGSSDRRCGKAPITYVKVSFSGLAAKTAIYYRSNNPKYYEQISFIEMFPSISRFIRTEIYSAEDNFKKPFAFTDLALESISHDGENGFLPTFGPSLLHMYGSANGISDANDDGPYYRGSILISLKTIVPYYKLSLRTVNVEPVTPLNQEDLWEVEEMCLYCPILEVSMLDRQVAGKLCGVAITFGEIPVTDTKNTAFVTMMNELRTNKYHYTGCLSVTKLQPYGYLDFSSSFPVLQIATYLPNFSFRMYRFNVIKKIFSDLKIAIDEVEDGLKLTEQNISKLNNILDSCLMSVKSKILNFMDYTSVNNSTTSSYETDLDKKVLALQREELDKIHHRISNIKGNIMQDIQRTKHGGESDKLKKKIVKALILEAKLIANDLKKLLINVHHGWPDVVIWLLNEGSRVAYYKLSPIDIIHSSMENQRGKYCGKLQTILMKPLKCQHHVLKSCSCVVGKLDVMFWLGSYHERTAFETCLPGYKLKLKNYDMCLKCPSLMLEIRAFIHKAKISTNLNRGKVFVRINIFNAIIESKTIDVTSLEWNQVLRTQRMVFVTPERLWISPPVACVEVCYVDALNNLELLGSGLLKCNIEDRQEYEFAPKLEWHKIYKNTEYTGQILMSIQVIQILEKLMKSTIYTPVEESFVAAGVTDIETSDIVDSIPKNMLPVSSTYKLDVYWWGLRNVNITRRPCVSLEFDEMVMKSDVTENNNFPNGRMSYIFQGSTLCPLLIKLYDSTTFGRTLYLGANAVKNPRKYFVNWIPKNEREASLHRASIMSSDFVQVNQNVCIKKSRQKKVASSESIISMHTRRGKWPGLCCTGPNEEEYINLLPVVQKKKTDRFDLKKERNWWSRYLQSMENCVVPEDNINTTSDKLTIFDSELELQPQFSKFKDWCSTLKLYYEDNKSRTTKRVCGHLKVGLAIYEWPPPNDTTAVSNSGVDLNKGYFDDHPCNDPAKFLVRVYIIKAFNLKTREFSGKSDPYTIVSCGKKHFGNRANYVANTANPIFGKTYEFRCNLPEDYSVSISLYDYNAIVPDVLIGSTSIDLEDRIYSKHRPCVGLASEYNIHEPFKWRDSVKPSTILEELCQKNHLSPPVYLDNSTIMVNGVTYVDENKQDGTYVSSIERKENLCLSILHNWHTVPICGYQLVPEHVETRTLYKDDSPGIEQGKVHMWVDIFPLQSDTFIPPPLDIRPKDIEDYELRLTIVALRDLKYKKSQHNHVDLFVKAWIGSNEFMQEGKLYDEESYIEGYHCKLIFNFQYQHFIRKLYKKEADPFTEYEERLSPVLVIQIIEHKNDGENECLGFLKLNLNTMPQGTPNPHKCSLENLENNAIDLFNVGYQNAWWPLQNLDDKGNVSMAGMVNLEMNLLPLEKAILMPIGLEKEANYFGFRSAASTKGCENRRILFLILFICIITWILVNVFCKDLPAKLTYYFTLLWS